MTPDLHLFERLPRFRAVGTHKFVASCPGPLHRRGDKNCSLSGEVADQKILLHCFVGCTIAEICHGAGVEVSDLFLDRPPRPPVRTKRDVAIEHLSQWRERALPDVCATLRSLDSVIREIHERFRSAGVDDLQFNPAFRMSRTDFEVAVDQMEAAYKLRSNVEFDFERLNSKDPAAWAKVWREGKRAAE